MSEPSFRTLPPDGPVRVAVVGAGAMGRAWLHTIRDSPDVELAGIVDLDVDAALHTVTEVGVEDTPVVESLTALATTTAVDAVVNVTVPVAHYPVTLEAFQLGLPVLGEKPLAATLSEAVALTAATEESGQLFMVSQSRRYNAQLAALKAGAGQLGGLGIVTTEFFKAPRFGGFRETMAHPLLLDMAIHPFDTARYLMNAEPVSVYCEEYNPEWSWFQGDAATTAIFTMTGGRRYVYTASWCSPGLETSWNGSWRLSGSAGSARWDGDNPPEFDLADTAAVPPPDTPGVPGESIAGSLAEFVSALRTGKTPMGEVHENLMSLAMVFAAVESAETGVRVNIEDVLARARS